MNVNYREVVIMEFGQKEFLPEFRHLFRYVSEFEPRCVAWFWSSVNNT